jgi:ABC-type siderophore export system fused ATPase/permease subunit
LAEVGYTFTMSLYALPQFVGAVMFFSIAAYVFLQSSSSPVNRIFVVWMILSALWQGFYGRKIMTGTTK